MKKILSAFVKYPFYGKMFIAVVVLLGGISLFNMKKATFPLTKSHKINVSVAYPGASPKEMEEGVTTLIENAVRGLPGIKEFSSESRENFASVSITALNGYDIDNLVYDIKNAVDGISNFPAAAEKPIVVKVRRTDMAMYLSLHTDGDDLLKLHNEANRIEDDFLSTGFISQIQIFGLPKKLELSVEINQSKLDKYNLTIDDIKNAIAANNNDIHAGTIRNPREELLVISRQRSVKPVDIENIVVRGGRNGHNILVGDVCKVKLQFEESPGASYVNGGRNVVIFISKLRTEDLEQISNYVRKYIKKYNVKHPHSEIVVLHDFLDNIDSQLNILISNGFLGVLLVIVLLSLLLNVRLSLWVAWGIPASFLGMFIIAGASGVTLNLISLFGMILIIGILVDDGIVIGENVFSHFEMGKSPRRAAIEGTLEVLPAVLASVSTTIVAFLPLLFIEGNLEMIYEMAFVVIASLVVSLLEGMFVLPGHLVSSNALRPIKKKSVYGKIRANTDKFIFALRDRIYIPSLKWTFRHKFVTLMMTISLFILTVGLFVGGVIPFTFFPPSPANMFTIDMAMKPGTNKEITLKRLNYIEKKVWEVNEELHKQYKDTISYVKITEVNLGNSFSGGESGTHAGSVRVFLNKIDLTDVTDDIIKNAVFKKLGNMPDVYKIGVGASHRFGAPVSLSVMGYDLDQIDSAKNMLISSLKKISSLYNIVDNSQLGVQEVRLSLKPEAYSLGLTQLSLVQQVRNAYYGGLAQRMQNGKDEIWLYVRYPRTNRKNLGQLEQLTIKTPKGKFMLSQVANMKFSRSLNKITRYNGRREVRVDAYMRNPNEAVPPIITLLKEDVLPTIQAKYPDVDFMFQGQQKDSTEEMGSLMKYYGIAFLIIILIVMMYFKSAREGIIVLMMIPFGILGSLWGHGIHGEPFSMMSLWGLVAMSGTVINDAIVFIAKYNSNLVEGMKVPVAAFEAGRARFRAIFLTTVTTTAGIMPLILSKSSDARFLVPMATSLAYGIFFGTLFILYLTPHLLQMFNRINLVWVRLVTGEKIAAEDVEVAVKNDKIDKMLNKNMQKKIEHSQNVDDYSDFLE